MIQVLLQMLFLHAAQLFFCGIMFAVRYICPSIPFSNHSLMFYQIGLFWMEAYLVIIIWNKLDFLLFLCFQCVFVSPCHCSGPTGSWKLVVFFFMHVSSRTTSIVHWTTNILSSFYKRKISLLLSCFQDWMDQLFLSLCSRSRSTTKSLLIL